MSSPRDKSPLKTGMVNLSEMAGDYLTEFPKLLYRATTEETRYVQTTHDNGDPKTWLVTNKFNGHLCDTVVAESADDAETLAADGWDVSPEAAHGVVVGLQVATSAKDAEIAELRAEMARMQAAQTEKRGPGRPPRVVDETAV